MKTCCHPSVSLFGAALLLIPALPGEGLSQVNEQKILREASGTYKGARTGGQATFSGAADPVANPSFSVTPPTYKGKFKIPASSKNPKVSLSLPGQLPGSGKGVYRGKRKKAKVAPNGRKITYKVVKGVGSEDDGQPSYAGGTVAGTIRKNGGKWSADLKMSATQGNRAGTYPTKAVRNMKVKGRQ